MSAAERWSDRSVTLLAAMVALCAALCYANTLFNEFVSDDHPLILDHPYTKRVSDWPRIFTVGHYQGYGGYRPLTTLSFAINYSLGVDHPAGYHLANLILHALNAALVFLLLDRLLRVPLGAMVGALLFAVHPIHTEAVAWISGRAELLATSFFLIAWLAHLITKTDERNQPGFRFLSLLAFFAAILAKENALILPVVIIFSDLFEQRHAGVPWAWREQWKRSYLPYFGTVGFYFAFRAVLYHQSLLRAPSDIAFIDNPLVQAGPVARLFTAIAVQGHYLWLLVWPAKLCGDYSFDSIPIIAHALDPALWLSLLAIGLLVVIGFRSWQQRGSIWFGLFFYALAILPTANLLTVIGSIQAERFLYLPSLGFCLVAGALAANSLGWLRHHGRRWRIATAATVFLLACLLIAGAAKTWLQNRVWRDDYSLWKNTVELAPQNIKAQLRFGGLALEKGEFETALASFREARRIDPKSQDAALNLGAAFLATGRRQEAIAIAQDAVRQDPKCVDCRINLALTEITSGNLDEGIQQLRDALAIDPADALAHYNLARAWSMKTQPDNAIEEYQRAIALKPDYAEAWNALGAVYLRTGKRNEARAALERALELKPDYPEALRNLSLIRPSP